MFHTQQDLIKTCSNSHWVYDPNLSKADSPPTFSVHTQLYKSPKLAAVAWLSHLVPRFVYRGKFDEYIILIVIMLTIASSLCLLTLVHLFWFSSYFTQHPEKVKLKMTRLTVLAGTYPPNVLSHAHTHTNILVCALFLKLVPLYILQGYVW